MAINIVEEAKQESESKLVAYAEFILDFKKNNNHIYCFYEGIDDRSFYSIRVQLSVSNEKEIFHYNCYGKTNVIDLQKLLSINKIYSESSLVYFVDKDFDKNDCDHRIYITPTYSIENLYSIDDAFKNILVNEYQIGKSSKTYTEAIELYQSTKQNFHNKILFINAFLSCQADLRQTYNLSTRLFIEKSLQKYFSKDIFDKCVTINFDINLPDDIMSSEGLEKIFNDAQKIPQEQFQDKVTKFQSIDQCTLFRGKFELKFLISFLTRFQGEIAKKSSIFSSKHTTSLRFEYATAISQLTNSAYTPICLREYLKKLN